MPQELVLLLRLQDEASAALRNVGHDIESVGISWKGVLAVAATVATTIAVVEKMTGAYDQQRVAIIKLQTVLGGVGVDYGSVSKQINAVTADYSKNTTYGITEQMNALAQLVMITRSYDDAMKYLPLSMDVATMRQMDLASAAALVGRALEGNTRLLSQFGFNIKEISGDPAAARAALENLAKTLDGVSTKVQTSSDRMKTAWDSLMISFGRSLAPGTDTIKNAFASVLDVITSVVEADQRLTSRMTRTYGIEIEGGAIEKVQAISDAINDIPTSKTVTVEVVEQVTSGWSYSSIYGIIQNDVLKYRQWLTAQTSSFQGWEGPIPGPTGQPYLAMVHGGEIISQPGRGAGGSINVNVYNAGSVVTSQDLMTQIRREVLWAKSRNYNAGLA